MNVRLPIVEGLLLLMALVAPLALADHKPLTYGEHEAGRVLVIGCVTNDPKYNYGRMQGIAEYMLHKMHDLNVDAVEVFTVDEPQKMIALLRSGRVDWVSATPFSAVRYAEEAGGEIVLAKEQHGQAWYQSVFFARKDSGIKTLADLRGKAVAFEKPDSTSAYFLPVAMLTEAGLPLVEMQGPREIPPEDAVGYVFSGEESNSTLWVHKGLVDAAAYSDSDFQSTWIAPPKLREDLVVFARSSRLPRSVEIVSPTLPEPLKERLKQVLLEAPADPDAQAALKQYYNATGFSELTGDMRTALEDIRNDLDLAASGF